ncbi:MAG TPA: hypothetical protein DEP35_19460, partial [Deltaproteobacteria bacterium]|nr:hypothetical protein [Deltaproteobacteria bacterium]
MRIRVSVPEEQVSPHVVNAALEAVTRLDEQLIKDGKSPTASQLISAGAVWKPEPPGDECFDHGGTLAQRGWGDCDDWAPLAAAEHRVKGTDPGAKAIVIPSGPNTYHAVVQRSDGMLEDPSLAAGMKPLKHARVSGPGEGGLEHGVIYIQACDPHDPSHVYEGSLLPTTSPMGLHCGPQIAVRPDVGCFEGRCDVPMAGSPLAPVRTSSVSGAGLPYSLAHQAYADHPGDALSLAVIGAIDTANACGFCDEADYAKLQALQGCLAGHDPRDVYVGLARICGEELAYDAVVGAHRIARRFV